MPRGPAHCGSTIWASASPSPRHRRTRGVVVGAQVGAAAGGEGVGDVEVTADDDVLAVADVAPPADHVELVRVVGIAGHFDVIEAEVPHLQAMASAAAS